MKRMTRIVAAGVALAASAAGVALAASAAGVALAASAAGVALHTISATAAARLPWCGVGVLRAAIVGGDAGAGNIYTTLALRNVGRVSCALRGYPGVSLVDGRGYQIGRSAKRFAVAAPLIVLRPGGAASTVIHTLNPGVGTTRCLRPSTALRVYPPDSYASLLVRARLSECLGVLEVRPLVAGLAGQ